MTEAVRRLVEAALLKHWNETVHYTAGGEDECHAHDLAQSILAAVKEEQVTDTFGHGLIWCNDLNKSCPGGNHYHHEERQAQPGAKNAPNEAKDTSFERMKVWRETAVRLLRKYDVFRNAAHKSGCASYGFTHPECSMDCDIEEPSEDRQAQEEPNVEYVFCETCGGTGKTDTTNPECLACKGTGKRRVLNYNYPEPPAEPRSASPILDSAVQWIEDLASGRAMLNEENSEKLRDLAKCVQASMKPPAEPEPVAWECQACDFIERFCEQEHFVRRAGVDPYSVCSGKLSPLYATPPDAAKRIAELQEWKESASGVLESWAKVGEFAHSIRKMEWGDSQSQESLNTMKRLHSENDTLRDRLRKATERCWCTSKIHKEDEPCAECKADETYWQSRR